jgi:hypothetical protein
MKALALAFGDESETAVGIPETGRNRNLIEQAEQSVRVASSCL